MTAPSHSLKSVPSGRLRIDITSQFFRKGFMTRPLSSAYGLALSHPARET